MDVLCRMADIWYLLFNNLLFTICICADAVSYEKFYVLL